MSWIKHVRNKLAVLLQQKRTLLGSDSCVAIQGVNESLEKGMLVPSNIGRVEITSPKRWDLDASGSTIQLGERMRLVTGASYLRHYRRTMSIPQGHQLTSNGKFEWRTSGDWVPSPIPAEFVGDIELRVWLPLGSEGGATRFNIVPVQ